MTDTRTCSIRLGKGIGLEKEGLVGVVGVESPRGVKDKTSLGVVSVREVGPEEGCK